LGRHSTYLKGRTFIMRIYWRWADYGLSRRNDARS